MQSKIGTTDTYISQVRIGGLITGMGNVPSSPFSKTWIPLLYQAKKINDNYRGMVVY